MTSETENVSDLAGPEPAPRVESGEKSSGEGAAAPQSDTSPAAAAPEGSSGAKFSPWPERLSAVVASLSEWLTRPRVRLTVTGIILLLVGALVVTSSVWTLPLIIVGVLMVVVAWIGRRLDGRIAVEWGEQGTQVEFRAEIKAAHAVRPAVAQAISTPQYVTQAPEPEDAEVVEGEAHTIEIEIAELKALIAAAETEQSDSPQADPSEQGKRNLRVAYRGDKPSEGAL